MPVVMCGDFVNMSVGAKIWDAELCFVGVKGGCKERQ